MKKKILITLTVALAIMLALAISVFADSVHEGRVDLDATVTLDNGTTVNLFDEDGNALIWFQNGSELQSIRADDERVKYKATYGFNVGNSSVGTVYVYEVSDMWIQLSESVKISKTSIVVLNLMDDDVMTNEASNNAYLNKPVNCVKTIQWANKVLEYAYLRLDTAAIQQQAFNGCTKLKYVNLESLTELRQIGGSQSFGGSSKLFENQAVDLSATKLITLSGEGTFNGVPLADVKFPTSLTYINNWSLQGTKLVDYAFPENVSSISGSQFNDCKSLKTIYINSTTTSIVDRAFNNTVLEKIFFVGTAEQLNALLDNTGTGSNAPFWAVVGENRANLISYADYNALEDKSGPYVVYDFSYCVAYKNGVHTADPARSNACVTTCSICENVDISHVNDNISVEYLYESYLKEGDKYTDCLNSGCDYETHEALEALFVNRGYSYEEGERGGIVADFGVNYNAVHAYENATGKQITYGMFAAYKSKLGTNDIFDENGKTNDGAFTAEIGNDKFVSLQLKIVGLTGEQKDFMLALGVYVNTVDGESKAVEFIQDGEKLDGEKYVFVSYNGLYKEDE